MMRFVLWLPAGGYVSSVCQPTKGALPTSKALQPVGACQQWGGGGGGVANQ